MGQVLSETLVSATPVRESEDYVNTAMAGVLLRRNG